MYVELNKIPGRKTMIKAPSDPASTFLIDVQIDVPVGHYLTYTSRGGLLALDLEVQPVTEVMYGPDRLMELLDRWNLVHHNLRRHIDKSDRCYFEAYVSGEPLGTPGYYFQRPGAANLLR